MSGERGSPHNGVSSLLLLLLYERLSMQALAGLAQISMRQARKVATCS